MNFDMDKKGGGVGGQHLVFKGSLHIFHCMGHVVSQKPSLHVKTPVPVLHRRSNQITVYYNQREQQIWKIFSESEMKALA